MTDSAIEVTSASELARAIRSGTSSLAVVQSSLDRIERLDPALRAWVYVDRTGALETARALDTEARAGRFRGPLHGVPVAVKDIFDAAGMVTTSGAPPFAHRRPERDAEVVARLRQSGAIILGKTTTTPFAFADPTETRNPWDLDHTPGGSSAGSAASVAARMVPLALGSQTIGSTLRPAAYCGIVGLKPTYGLLSTTGVTPLSWSLDHVGIFARSVDDAAVVLGVLTGTPASAEPVARTPRLGVPRRLFEETASAEVRQHLDAVAGSFARAGAAVEDVALPPGAVSIGEVGRIVLRAEAASAHSDWFTAHADAYPPRIRELVEAGLRMPAIDYVTAQRERMQFKSEMNPVFERYDALLLPVAPAAAPAISEGTTGDPAFCAPWSFGGFPAIALPSGLSERGLPLAVQLVAGTRAEGRLLDVARWCEARLGFSAAPPS